MLEQVWSASSIVQAHFYLNLHLFVCLFVCSVCLFLMVAEKNNLSYFLISNICFSCIDCLFYSLIWD